MVQVNSFVDTIGVVPFRSAVSLFAKEKTRLEAIGMRLDDFDLLIGCTAVANDMILVTDNLKHMGRIQGVKTENWMAR